MANSPQLRVKWATVRNYVTREDLRASLEQYSRQPFADVLAELLNARPTPEEMRKWAQRAPDRWAHAVEIFAKLTGFTEKKEIAHNFFMSLPDMSQAELEQAIYEIELFEKTGEEPKMLSNSSVKAEDAQQKESIWTMLERPQVEKRQKKRGR